MQYLVQRDKGKNLRQNTRTAARQVRRQPVGEAVVVEGRPFRRPCDRRDPDTKHSLFFVSTSREGRAGPLSSLSDKPASPSDCDFWQRVDPFDSGYHWGPKFKEKKTKHFARFVSQRNLHCQIVMTSSYLDGFRARSVALKTRRDAKVMRYRTGIFISGISIRSTGKKKKKKKKVSK